MSIENQDHQSLEPCRGDMCKTFSLASPFHSVKVILKSTIVVSYQRGLSESRILADSADDADFGIFCLTLW